MSIYRRAWRWLTRTDVAAILIAVVLLLAALGSLFPQLVPTVAGDAERLARWQTAVRDRYGALTSLLEAAGAFRLFGSPLFLGVVALLAVSTLACVLNRWLAAWRGTGRGRWMAIVALAEHLAVLLLLLGAILSSFGWRETLTVGPGQTVAVGHGSGLALRNEGFTIARYPDGSPAGYEAQVAVAAVGQEAARRVGVNRPLAYRGVGVYLAGYQQTAVGYNVTLLAVRDPGYGLVVAAGVLFLLGVSARLVLE
jgi:cytochrome c biogenesis protein ResB